jgi:hypothetical protein
MCVCVCVCLCITKFSPCISNETPCIVIITCLFHLVLSTRCAIIYLLHFFRLFVIMLIVIKAHIKYKQHLQKKMKKKKKRISRMTRIYVWSLEKNLLKLYKLQTRMQVVQTSFNAISLNASCFLIHMSFLELHNVDAFFFFFFRWPFSSYTSYASCIYLLALPTKARILLCLDWL